MNFNDATRMRIHPGETRWVKADVNFLPVCRYPDCFDVDEKEVGAFVKFDGSGSIVSVERRVFT